MTHEEIYKLYRKTEYDSPKLLKVLADVCSITVEDLKQIIKDGDEISEMEKESRRGTRWTDEQHAIYDRMTAENAKPAVIAEAMGLPVKAVRAKRSNNKAKLNSIHKLSEKELDGISEEYGATFSKPATINKEFDELFDSNDTYADCAPDIDTGEDISDINAKIADLCETPDPITELKYGVDFGSKSEDRTVYTPTKVDPPKPDYTESLLETLREAIEFREPVYFACEPQEPPKPAEGSLHRAAAEHAKAVKAANEIFPRDTPAKPTPKQRTIFDEAHKMLWNLESSLKRISTIPDAIELKIDLKHIRTEATYHGHTITGYNIENPLAGTAIPTSGE